MGILMAEVEAAANTVQRTRCPIAHVLDELGEADRADLLAAISGTRFPAATIQKVLTGRGYRMGVGAVATHRRGGCSCNGDRG